MRRQPDLKDWDLDDAELAFTVLLYSRIGVERRPWWPGAYFHWATPFPANEIIPPAPVAVAAQGMP